MRCFLAWKQTLNTEKAGRDLSGKRHLVIRDEFSRDLFPQLKILRVIGNRADILENQFKIAAVTVTGIGNLFELCSQNVLVYSFQGNRCGRGLRGIDVFLSDPLGGDIVIRPGCNGDLAQVRYFRDDVNLVV